VADFLVRTPPCAALCLLPVASAAAGGLSRAACVAGRAGPLPWCTQLVVSERFSRDTSDGFDAYYAHADFVPASTWLQNPTVSRDRCVVVF
jgi:hypothetical protein